MNNGTTYTAVNQNTEKPILKGRINQLIAEMSKSNMEISNLLDRFDDNLNLIGINSVEKSEGATSAKPAEEHPTIIRKVETQLFLTQRNETRLNDLLNRLSEAV
jgi:hypothetical protein